MKTSLKSLFGGLVLAAGLLSGTNASAIDITGRIDFANGAATLNGPVATATAVTSIFGTQVASNPGVPTPTGDYAGTGGTAVTFQPFTFSPSLPATITNFWTFTIAAVTYGFDLTAITGVTQSVFGLLVEGVGVAKKTGFDNTSGNFTFSVQPISGSSNFTFSASSVVPEGGSAVAMLGMGLLGLAVMRKKLVKTA